MKRASYNFTSHWQVNAPFEKVWEIIASYDTWTTWWAGLDRLEAVHETPDHVGSRAKLIWRAKLGYRLETIISITSIEAPRLINFDSAGSLEGNGSWLVEGEGKNSRITITWNVATTKPWMNLLSPILRPIFVASHHGLMRAGERGLNRHLSAN